MGMKKPFEEMYVDDAGGAREPEVLIGDKEDYGSGWPVNGMYCVVMRKNMRLGGPRTGCTL
jgi:hypothetical protein